MCLGVRAVRGCVSALSCTVRGAVVRARVPACLPAYCGRSPLLGIPVSMHVGDRDCFQFHQSMAKTKAVLDELRHPDLE